MKLPPDYFRLLVDSLSMFNAELGHSPTEIYAQSGFPIAVLHSTLEKLLAVRPAD